MTEAEWQPIETAPKEPDAKFMVYGDGYMATVYYPDGRVDLDDLAAWGVYSSEQIFFTPTHWMPLPEPPNHEKPDE